MGEGDEDARTAIFRDLQKMQEQISVGAGSQTPTLMEAQESLEGLYRTCGDLIRVPQVLLALQAGDENLHETSLASSEISPPLSTASRLDSLKELIRLPFLEAPPLEADVMKGQLDYVADPDSYWQNQERSMEQFYVTLCSTLRIHSQQIVSRWLRFCDTSAAKAAMRPCLDWHLAKVEADMRLADERAQRIRWLPAGDEKKPRLESRDLIDYHRRAAHQHRVSMHVKQLIKTLDWSAHRAGCELLLRAKEQLREANTEAFEREGRVRDGVPLVIDSSEELNRLLRELISEFGISGGGGSTGGDSEGDGEGEGKAGAEASSQDSHESGATADPHGTTPAATMNNGVSTARDDGDILDDTREGDLLSLVKALFTKMFREQSPGLRFPPYGTAIAHGGGNTLGAGSHPNSSGAEPADPISASEAGSPVALDTLHLKEWNAPQNSTPTVPKVRSDCDKDVERGIMRRQAAVLGSIKRVDARLLGEANYIDEPSAAHAQKRVKEAAERHQYIALVVKGVVPPPQDDHDGGEEDTEGSLKLDPSIPRQLSTPKLQSYYYLRTLQIREAKRRILMNLNFFRSIQRTLAHDGERATGEHPKMDEVTSSYDTYFCTEDGLPIVQDLAGVNVVYDASMDDMEKLQSNMLKLGTHYINGAREQFDTEAANDETDADTLFYVDTMAVLADLFCSEASYQDAKRAAIETYFEALQHVHDCIQRQELSALITDCATTRPRLDMGAPYFTEGYSAEVVTANLRSQLLRQVSSDLILRQRNMESDERVSMGGDEIALVPAGDLSGTFDFYTALGLISNLAKAVGEVTTRIVRSFPTCNWDANMLSALECAVLQDAVVSWQLLGRQESIASASVHLRSKDVADQTSDDIEVQAGGSHHLGDPFILDNTHALELIITELRAELHQTKADINSTRLERETRELWMKVLHIFFLRNDLLTGVFETDVLARAYEMQLLGFKMNARSSIEELKAARGGEASALAVDYLPNIAISEFDGAFCAPDLHTRAGMKRLMSSTGVYELGVALQLQLAHRSLLAVVVDYNHSSLCQLALPTILAAGGQEVSPDESKDKKLKECFLSLHRFKKPLKDRLLKDYTLKSKDAVSTQRCKEIMYQLMGDYCKWLLARCRGFSIVAQISLHVQNIRWLTRFFKPDGDGVFNVVNNVPQEAVVDTDSPDIAPAPGSEDTGAKSAAQISDMSKFFMTEGADYDLWCLPELHSIMAVPEKDKSAGVVHSEEGLYLRYFTVTSIGALLRILYMRHSLLLADESACSDPVSVTRGVVAEMRQLRKDTVQLGSGSLPLETVIFLVNKSSAKWLTFLFAVAEWRDALALRRQEKAANIARNMLALRGCVSLHPYPYSLLTTGNEHIPIVDGQRKCQQTVMQRQLFGSDGITMRGLLLADQLSYMWDPATKFHNVDRGVFADIQHKINEALSAALVGVNLQQVAKATEALLEFTSCACAADLVKVALVESQTGDAKRQFASDNHISKASANLSPAQILLQQVKMNGEALQVGMLQREADLMRKKYSQLSGKAVNQIPPPMRWPGAQDRFRAKVTKIAQTLEDLKASSDFVVSDDGENTLMIAEVELEAKMDALARELRTWGENEIADARRIERADAAHVEHLMHAQEHRTTHAQRALELLKKSFARRVDAEIIDRNYQQLLDNDRLRRKLRILRDDMKQQENVIRKAVRAEYEDLVTELASKLAASKARFKEFHVQLTQGTLHSLNDLKRETLKGMENHKVTPVGFKKIAGELQEQVSAEDEQRQESLDAQRAVLKIKTLYHMKEIKLKMEHKNAMDAIEKQEQAQKVSSGDGREMMEEKVALLQVRLYTLQIVNRNVVFIQCMSGRSNSIKLVTWSALLRLN